MDYKELNTLMRLNKEIDEMERILSIVDNEYLGLAFSMHNGEKHKYFDLYKIKYADVLDILRERYKEKVKEKKAEFEAYKLSK